MGTFLYWGLQVALSYQWHCDEADMSCVLVYGVHVFYVV